MKSKIKVTKTQRKWWVLSKAYHDYAEILAVCKTKKEAKRLRYQNKSFMDASIDNAPEYMHQY
ncbi:hypothetical protein LCGC14_2334760 [marine sediment metagenome]|uniref:Uncharacterized protein n=1 Tax=marine sediment metagenome TaxID=412755 RepID=A0A0F9CDR2_9ZZZZ